MDHRQTKTNRETFSKKVGMQHGDLSGFVELVMFEMLDEEGSDDSSCSSEESGKAAAVAGNAASSTTVGPRPNPEAGRRLRGRRRALREGGGPADGNNIFKLLVYYLDLCKL